MDIRPEELEYILIEFSRKNMVADMAMFFITQDITSDDLFYLDYSTKDKFYVDVFRYIYKYSIDKINRGKADDVILNILPKLTITEYTKKKKSRMDINRDWIMGEYVEGILTYLYNEGYVSDCIYAIDTLLDNYCDISVIKSIMLKNRHIDSIDLLTSMISRDLFSVGDIVDIIIDKNDYLSDDKLYRLLDSIFYNKDLLMSLLRLVMSNFNISIYEDRRNKDVVTIGYKTMKVNKRKMLTRLAIYLHDIIYSDVEYEMASFLMNTYQTLLYNGRKFHADLMYSLMKWFSSDERQTYKINNYKKYSFEEDPNLFEEDTWRQISLDLDIKQYIFQIEELSGYDLFLRAFNCNRFKFLQFNNSETIRDLLNNQYKFDPYNVTYGIDPEIYYFLNHFSSEKYNKHDVYND